MEKKETIEDVMNSDSESDQKQLHYKIYDFSAENLYEALSNKRCSSTEIANKKRAQYLYLYLKDLQAKTIIVEYDYTDRDYLDDFAAYYVRCFQSYERRCKRVHFFSTIINEVIIKNIIRNESSDGELCNSYLGFVVARPLPDAIIGRTVLKTYESDGGRRNFTSVLSSTLSNFRIRKYGNFRAF
jgi:hypothetical protein